MRICLFMLQDKNISTLGNIHFGKYPLWIYPLWYISTLGGVGGCGEGRGGGKVETSTSGVKVDCYWLKVSRFMLRRDRSLKQWG